MELWPGSALLAAAVPTVTERGLVLYSWPAAALVAGRQQCLVVVSRQGLPLIFSEVSELFFYFLFPSYSYS